MQGLHVRPATWDDRADVARLIAAMGSHEDVLEQSEPLSEIGRLITEPMARALVAEIDGRVVGYAELQARPSSLHGGVEGWLAALAVEPGLRRAGVGAALMEAVEEQARNLACDEIVLESSTWRNSAHAFYRKLGFRQGTPAERFRREQLSTSDDMASFLAVAARAAARVTSVLAPWIGVSTPGKDADLEAESAAIGVLSTLGLPVLGEETGWSEDPDGSRRWICLDAVDGSRNLRAGLPPWAFSAALVEGGRSVAGFACNLATGRRWWAVGGRGAWVDGRPAHPRRSGLVAAGSRSDQVPSLPAWAERVRILGSSVVELCSVADGSVGGFVGVGGVTLFTQDLAAASVILEEAGACLVDARMSPVRIEPDRTTTFQVVAAPDREAATELVRAAYALTPSRDGATG